MAIKDMGASVLARIKKQSKQTRRGLSVKKARKLRDNKLLC